MHILVLILFLSLFLLPSIIKIKTKIDKQKAKEEAVWARAAKKYASERQRQIREEQRLIREKEKIEKQEARSRAIMEEAKANLEFSLTCLEDRYADSIRKHAELRDQIQEALLQKRIDDVVLYCEKDIALIPMVYDYFTRKSIIENVDYHPEPIDTYKNLSFAYESMRDYDRAILACKDAIDMGLATGMEERIFELEQKRKEMIVHG